MSYKLDFKRKPDYLYVQVTGIRTLETVTKMATNIFNACIENKMSKVLIDVQGLKGRLKTMEAYEVPTSVFPELKGLGIEKAAVVDLREFKDSFNFFETVAVNRGYNLRIFDNINEAKKWLCGYQ